MIYNRGSITHTIHVNLWQPRSNLEEYHSVSHKAVYTTTLCVVLISYTLDNFYDTSHVYVLNWRNVTIILKMQQKRKCFILLTFHCCLFSFLLNTRCNDHWDIYSVNCVFQSLFKWQNFSTNWVSCTSGYIQTLFTSLPHTHTFTYSRFMIQWTQMSSSKFVPMIQMKVSYERITNQTSLSILAGCLELPQASQRTRWLCLYVPLE